MSCLILKDIRKIYRISDEKKTKTLSILVQDDTIQKIAPYDEIVKTVDKNLLDNTTIINCSDCIALPGFVDSHTHLLFYGSREKELYMRAAGKSYLDILESGGGIHSTVHAVKSASEEELIQNGLKFLDKALQCGTTTVEIKSGYGLDFETETKMLRVINRLNDLHPMDIIPTYLVHTVPKNVNRKKYINEIVERMIPEFREYADWFDIFLEKGVFDLKEGEFLIRKAMDTGYHVGIHTNQVHDIGGVRLADELGVRHIDHLEVLKKDDAERILRNKTLYSVFLPSAEAYVFSKHVGQIHQLKTIPDRIVLSTDFNPGSSPVLNPLFVISLAVLRYRIFDPYFLIDAFTTNPARMLYLNDRGIILEGTKADILCIELDNFEQIPYYGTVNFLKRIIKNGEIIEF